MAGSAQIDGVLSSSNIYATGFITNWADNYSDTSYTPITGFTARAQSGVTIGTNGGYVVLSSGIYEAQFNLSYNAAGAALHETCIHTNAGEVVGAEMIRETAGAINYVGGSVHCVLNVSSGTAFSVKTKQDGLSNILIKRMNFTVRRLP